jgi:hypothetical protein
MLRLRAQLLLLAHLPPMLIETSPRLLYLILLILQRRLLQLRLLLRRCAIKLHRDRLPKLRIDVLQTPSLGLRAHEVHKHNMQCGRDDEDKEELPGYLIEGDWARNKEDDVGEVEAHHAETGALGADMGGEDFCDVEELGGVEEGTPEGCDEEEDEEDSGILAGAVVSAEKL